MTTTNTRATTADREERLRELIARFNAMRDVTAVLPLFAEELATLLRNSPQWLDAKLTELGQLLDAAEPSVHAIIDAEAPAQLAAEAQRLRAALDENERRRAALESRAKESRWKRRRDLKRDEVARAREAVLIDAYQAVAKLERAAES